MELKEIESRPQWYRKSKDIFDFNALYFITKWHEIGNFTADISDNLKCIVHALRYKTPGLALQNHNQVERYPKFGVEYIEFYEFKSTKTKHLVIGLIQICTENNEEITRIYATKEGLKFLEPIGIVAH